MKTTNPSTRSSTSRLPLRLALFLLPVAFCWVAFSVQAISPPPDGGYPGANTAEGGRVLLSNTGFYNTAIGYLALEVKARSRCRAAT